MGLRYLIVGYNCASAGNRPRVIADDPTASRQRSGRQSPQPALPSPRNTPQNRHPSNTPQVVPKIAIKPNNHRLAEDFGTTPGFMFSALVLHGVLERRPEGGIQAPCVLAIHACSFQPAA